MNTAQKTIAWRAIAAIVVAVIFVPMVFVVLVIVTTAAVAGFLIVLASGPEYVPSVDHGPSKDEIRRRARQQLSGGQQAGDRAFDSIVVRRVPKRPPTGDRKVSGWSRFH